VGMKYKVIIPVVNRELAVMLLDSIAANTVIPDHILIIDNSMNKTAFPIVAGLSVEIITSRGKRLGVNASWNLGICNVGDCDYVAILNDDVVLGKYFFEKNIHAFQTYPDCGVACPETVHRIDKIKETDGKVICMKKREGWAFSFRMDVLKKIPPVPNQLTTFCGDDWFWIQTGMQGYRWYKDTGNIVYHKVGAAVRQLGARKYLNQDKAALQEML